jgi:peptidyl-prolyl cis-trans isomerase C
MRLNIPVLLDDTPNVAPVTGAAPRPGLAGEHDHDHDPSLPLPGPAPVFVRVAGQPISETDIAREMQHHRAARPEQVRAEAARALVVQSLLRLEIERLGLAAASLPEGGETHEEAAIRVLIEREVPTPEPTEVDCRRYFEANRERLTTPPQAQLRHILLAAAPADPFARNKARELGEQLIQMLKIEPTRFAELAALHSACPSREAGGELGWIEPGETVPEFERQVFRLKPGLAGLTVESRYGHHVVTLDAFRAGEPLDFDACHARVATYLETQAKQNALHQYLNILAERHGVEGLEELAIS